MSSPLVRSLCFVLLTVSCGKGAGTPDATPSGGAGGAVSGASAGAGAGNGVSGSGSGGVAGGGLAGSQAEGGGGGAAGGASAGGAGAGAGGSSAGAGGSAGQPAVCPFSSDEYFLWPAVAPGSAGATVVEAFDERSKDPAVHDRSVSGVTKPSLFAYLAKTPNGAAAIIAPGGGYTHLAWDKEGVDIAKWLNSLGVSAFVLKYRMPGDFPGKSWIALADAQRALRTVRKNAAACGINTARIGVIGFSAGGHLASTLETRPNAETSPATDAIDAVDAQPSFGVLMYPVISMDSAIAHAGSKTALLGASPSAADVTLYSSELQVTAKTPPTFLGVSIKDTTVKPENSQRFDDALKAKGVAHELHLYQDGGHGTGLAAPGDMAAWPTQCAAFLKAQKLL
jgi:acetyl esterase/lipase